MNDDPLARFVRLVRRDQPRLARRMRGASKRHVAALAEFAPLPPEYRRFLALMGGNGRDELAPFWPHDEFDAAAMLDVHRTIARDDVDGSVRAREPAGWVRLALHDAYGVTRSLYLAPATASAAADPRGRARVAWGYVDRSGVLHDHVHHGTLEEFLLKRLFDRHAPLPTVPCRFYRREGDGLDTSERFDALMARAGFRWLAGDPPHDWYLLYEHDDGTWVWFEQRPSFVARWRLYWAFVATAHPRRAHDVSAWIQAEFDVDPARPPNLATEGEPLGTFERLLARELPHLIRRLRPAGERDVAALCELAPPLPPEYRRFLALMGGNRRGELGPFMPNDAFDAAHALVRYAPRFCMLPEQTTYDSPPSGWWFLSQRFEHGMPSWSTYLAPRTLDAPADPRGRVRVGTGAVHVGPRGREEVARWGTLEEYLVHELFTLRAGRSPDEVDLHCEVDDPRAVRARVAALLARAGLTVLAGGERDDWYQLFEHANGAWIWFESKPASIAAWGLYRITIAGAPRGWSGEITRMLHAEFPPPSIAHEDE